MSWVGRVYEKARFDTFCGCHFHAYTCQLHVQNMTAEDFIGKTSAEIVDENGGFDCVIGEADDGIYSNCKCGYTIKEKKAGFLGSSDEVLFFICFDERGCDEL